MIVNNVHGLVYTTIIYHDVFESLHAYLFGVMIGIVAFTVDTFSNALYNLVVVTIINRKTENPIEREFNERMKMIN
jgi:hypothetical protein